MNANSSARGPIGFAALRTLFALWLWAPLAVFGAPPAGDIPPFSALVVDETAALGEEDRQQLVVKLQGIQSSGRAQVAVLVAKDTRGQALADFSLHVAEAWKVGRKKRDDGVLLVVVPSRPAVRIEVGYGLEGAIPDAVAAGWIDEVLPALKGGQVADVVHYLVGRIDEALPQPQATSASTPEWQNVLDSHPEWAMPFVFVVFSPFALFPLFFNRWGALASAPLFAGMLGAAAWTLWASQPRTAVAAAIAFLLPLGWAFNHLQREKLKAWQLAALNTANAAAVAIFFGVLAMFIGVGLSGQREATWAALLFAGAMALGLTVFLFPGRIGWYAGIVLRSYMHFCFILTIAYLSLAPIHPDPTRIAFAIAGGLTALIALALWLDARDAKRASLWIVALVLLAMLPLGGLLLLQGALGEDFNTQVLQLAAGGGSIGAVLLWAGRLGFFAVLRIGLGGRFGGGGAEGEG